MHKLSKILLKSLKSYMKLIRSSLPITMFLYFKKKNLNKVKLLLHNKTIELKVTNIAVAHTLIVKIYLNSRGTIYNTLIASSTQ